MSVSSAFPATIKRVRRGSSNCRAQKMPPLVGEVAGQFVLESQLLFLETVEKVFVGMGPMLFFLDEGVKSLMLRLQFLDHCLVHWRGSFRSA